MTDRLPQHLYRHRLDHRHWRSLLSHSILVAIASLIVGIVVGAGYALIGLRSPAPPIIALLGLLGMVTGEQATRALLAKWHSHEATSTKTPS